MRSQFTALSTDFFMLASLGFVGTGSGKGSPAKLARASTVGSSMFSRIGSFFCNQLTAVSAAFSLASAGKMPAGKA